MCLIDKRSSKRMQTRPNKGKALCSLLLYLMEEGRDDMLRQARMAMYLCSS